MLPPQIPIDPQRGLISAVRQHAIADLVGGRSDRLRRRLKRDRGRTGRGDSRRQRPVTHNLNALTEVRRSLDA